MESRYSREAALAYSSSLKNTPREIAERTYTARLLGQDASLVLHGGGNTSVKTEMTTRTGERAAVLCVKGSGWDLATIEPAGHPACRLEHLAKMLACKDMSDEDMVNELRHSLLDASAPTPSVEALLHAALPFTYIDHTHADAVLAIVDQENAESICSQIYGEDVLFVPYVMPGFFLAKRCDDLFRNATERGKKPRVMILERHGIFTWGATAEESYASMIAMVDKAERFVATRAAADASRSKTNASPNHKDEKLAARVLPILRGVFARAHGLREERGFILDVRSNDLDFLARNDIRAIIAKGCATPDHVIRTKPTAMFFDPSELATNASDDAMRDALERAVAIYATEYDAYFSTMSREKKVEKKKLDSLPRVVLVPGIGIISIAPTKKEASIAADIYEHTISVMKNATAVGSYSPVSMSDLFDVEYWSLEQAKIKKVAVPSLGQRIALVTGAASGIGLATTELYLQEGAHLVAVDRDAEALAAVIANLAKKYGDRVTSVVADVTQEADVKRAFAHAIETFGGIDVVVSNAGNAPEGLLHTDAGDEKLRASITLNLLSHNTVAKHASDIMRAQKTGGALLFNASKSAFNQGPGFGPYAVAKTALVALVRQYAVDLGSSRIRSNAVNADRIRTGLFGGGVLESRAKARGLAIDDYFRANLLSREVTGEDVAAAFHYLANARSTTGCIITVDGGNAAAFPR